MNNSSSGESNNDILATWIYYQSRIPNLDDFYFSMAQVSYNMHISQTDIYKLEYWEYNNLLVYLTRIIDEENKRNNPDGASSSAKDQHSGMMKSSQNMMKSNMRSSKNMMKKMPHK